MNPAVFLHTADWQLGKVFGGVADAHKRTLLQRKRIDAIARIGAAAREHGARFILVAGDLFESPHVTSTTVSAACAEIGALGLPVFVIPGNHDHGGPGSVWEQRFFLRERDQLAPNLTVLLTPQPVELENAILLPCPLLRRHEPGDTTEWLRALALPGGKPRIVLAHGSVQSFAARGGEGDDDGAANRLDLARLPASEFDYIALGDWHGTKQVAPHAWYAGTPEPDRFPRGEGNMPGHVLAVSAARGAQPQVTAVQTAAIGWHETAREFAHDAELERFVEEIDALIGQRAQQDLLRLELRGHLGFEAMSRLEQHLESWEARLLRLDLANHVQAAPSGEELAALTERAADPLIARVARRLHERAGAGDAIAGAALRELHAACRET